MGVIIIILLCVIGFLVFNQPTTNNEDTHEKVSVGEASFTIPEGYNISDIHNDGEVNLTNGNTTLYLVEYNGNNLTKYVNKSLEYVESQNLKPIVSNFSIENTFVEKLTIDGKENYLRYWFVDNDKTYCVYTFTGDGSTDNTINYLVKSLHEYK
ncbi:hypothetical protein [Methanobrevibacter sp.]|uniref:hypothetical protein n=1 Tax=Methanobrevibacter sp. TaxID=66852 RepID=UPI00386FC374